MRTLIIASTLLSLVALPVLANDPLPIEETIWRGNYQGEAIRIFWHRYGKYVGWESDSDSGIVTCESGRARNATGNKIDSGLERLLVQKGCR